MKTNDFFSSSLSVAYETSSRHDRGVELSHLRTLAAVVDLGTFEAAADELHITPSAVSQRIRALESSCGRVVVRRSTPVAATPDGAVLLRLARQVELLAAEADAELRGLAPGPGDTDGSGPATSRTPLPVAVNADSLATWFAPVLSEAARWDDVDLRLDVEDQDHSLDLLRAGAVLGAVTSEARPVAGCVARRLGVMRYVPAAAPWLVERHGGDYATMPVLRFNAKDELQTTYLAARGAPAPSYRQVPASQAFLEAVLAGLGWGLLPDHQLARPLREGRLVALPGEPVDVPLFWHRWRLASTRLDRLTGAVLRAAASLTPLSSELSSADA